MQLSCTKTVLKRLHNPKRKILPGTIAIVQLLVLAANLKRLAAIHWVNKEALRECTYLGNHWAKITISNIKEF